MLQALVNVAVSEAVDEAIAAGSAAEDAAAAGEAEAAAQAKLAPADPEPAPPEPPKHAWLRWTGVGIPQSESIQLPDVVELIRAGTIVADCVVWTEGFAGWVALETVLDQFAWPEGVDALAELKAAKAISIDAEAELARYASSGSGHERYQKARAEAGLAPQQTATAEDGGPTPMSSADSGSGMATFVAKVGQKSAPRGHSHHGAETDELSYTTTLAAELQRHEEQRQLSRESSRAAGPSVHTGLVVNIHAAEGKPPQPIIGLVSL